MSERVSRLVTEQAALIRECRGEIESSKLAIWQLQAEYDDLKLQLARAKKRLVESESQYASWITESKRLSKELSAVGESFSKEHCKALLTLPGKTSLMLDLAEALCTMSGFTERSWEFFRVRHEVETTEGVQDAQEELTKIAAVTKSHQLEKMVNSGTAAEEMQPLITWLLLSVQEVQCESSAAATSLKLPLLAKEKNEIYTQTKELEESISELKSKLERLLECVESAEKNIRRLQEAKDPSADEIEETEHQCIQTGLLAKRNVSMDNIISHMAKSEEFKAIRELDIRDKASSSTALVNSLYISHAISPQLQGQLKCILESQAAPLDDLNESSVDHTETLQVPRASPESQCKPPIGSPNTVQSSSEKGKGVRKKSDLETRALQQGEGKPRKKKNKCCGFV